MTRPQTRVSVAVRALFLVFGLELGTWVVAIPSVQSTVGFSLHTLGLLLLIMATASLSGMYASGGILRRVASEPVVTAAALATSLAVLAPAVSHSLGVLGLSLAIFGFSLGLLDASMNSQAVEVERRSGRPMINGFHAWASGGGLVASGLAVLTLAAGFTTRQSFMTSSLLGLITSALACRILLQTRPGPGPGARARKGVPRSPRPRWTRRTVLVGSMGFALFLAEGVANDWSAVHLRVSLGASTSAGACAFGAFSVSMLVMRLLADRLVTRTGTRRYCVIGCVIGSGGVITAALSTHPVLAIVGWGVFGLGIAGCGPLVFSAGGSLYPDEAAVGVSRAASMAYVGLLAGPSVIGFLAPLVTLRGALAVPVLCCLYAALVAGRALAPAAPDRSPDVQPQAVS